MRGKRITKADLWGWWWPSAALYRHVLRRDDRTLCGAVPSELPPWGEMIDKLGTPPDIYADCPRCRTKLDLIFERQMEEN